MKDFNFLFGAYLAFFLLVIAYLHRIGSRQKKILREMEHLRRTLNSYGVDNELNQA